MFNLFFFVKKEPVISAGSIRNKQENSYHGCKWHDPSSVWVFEATNAFDPLMRDISHRCRVWIKITLLENRLHDLASYAVENDPEVRKPRRSLERLLSLSIIASFAHQASMSKYGGESETATTRVALEVVNR